MFDLSRYIEDSTKASGVPVKVRERRVLMQIAEQLNKREVGGLRPPTSLNTSDMEAQRVHEEVYRNEAS